MNMIIGSFILSIAIIYLGLSIRRLAEARD